MFLTTQGCRWHEQLWVMASRFYEELRVVADMKGFGFCTQGSRSYEQLKVMDNMNDLGCRELSFLDFMNWSRLGK